MYDGSKRQPNQHSQIFLLKHSRHREHRSQGREIPRIHVLVENVERCPGNGDGQQRGDQRDPTPASAGGLE